MLSSPPVLQSVLHGIFPAVAIGAGAAAVRLWWMRRPITLLRDAAADPSSLTNLKAVYRFSGPDQV